jgi:hypothetical protein
MLSPEGIEAYAREFIRVHKEDGLSDRDVNQAALYFPPFTLDDVDLPEFQEAVANALWVKS